MLVKSWGTLYRVCCDANKDLTLIELRLRETYLCCTVVQKIKSENEVCRFIFSALSARKNI